MLVHILNQSLLQVLAIDLADPTDQVKHIPLYYYCNVQGFIQGFRTGGKVCFQYDMPTLTELSHSLHVDIQFLVGNLAQRTRKVILYSESSATSRIDSLSQLY